jgi:hypothetical protein
MKLYYVRADAVEIEGFVDDGETVFIGDRPDGSLRVGVEGLSK